MLYALIDQTKIDCPDYYVKVCRVLAIGTSELASKVEGNESLIPLPETLYVDGNEWLHDENMYVPFVNRVKSKELLYMDSSINIHNIYVIADDFNEDIPFADVYGEDIPF